MNLNTLLRHEVLNDAEMVDFVAAKIADAEEIRSARRCQRSPARRGRRTYPCTTPWLTPHHARTDARGQARLP